MVVATTNPLVLGIRGDGKQTYVSPATCIKTGENMKVSWFISLFSWTSIILILWGFMLGIIAWNLTSFICTLLMVVLAVSSATLVTRPVGGENDV